MNLETLSALGANLRPFPVPPSTNPIVLKLKAKAQEMTNRAKAALRNADSLYTAGMKASLEGDGENADRYYQGAKDARLEANRLYEWADYYEQQAKDAAQQPPPKIPLRGMGVWPRGPVILPPPMRPWREEILPPRVKIPEPELIPGDVNLPLRELPFGPDWTFYHYPATDRPEPPERGVERPSYRNMKGTGVSASQLAAMGAQPLGQELVIEEDAGPAVVTTAEGVGFIGGLITTIVGAVIDSPFVGGFGTSLMAASAFSSIARQSQS